MTRRAPSVRRALRRQVRFRAARSADLELLVDHRLAMWRDIGTRSERALRAHAPVYRRWIRPMLASGKVEAIIAEVDGRPIGSGALWWMPAHPRPGLPAVDPYIMSMYTDPQFRGVGLATEIVERLVRSARREGAFRVLLHASTQGRPVYARLGFETTGEMRRVLKKPAAVQAAHPSVTPRGRAGSRRSAPGRSGTGRPRSHSRRRGRSGRTGRN
jgi:GNAT superfamily N-acetyltransferase